MSRLFALLIAIAAAALVAFGCGKVTSPGGYGTVRVSLTDAPADYDSLVLFVREVAVHRAGPDDAGWSSLTLTQSTIDLLQLRNGVFTNLGAALVPAGHYTQVRLLLDPGSYIVVDGVRHDLFVPSGLQSGFKIVGEFDVPADGAVDVGVDLDAARSVHRTGNGRYMLRPTARVEVLSATGSITGTVVPADTASAVFAVAAAGDTVASTITSATGAFTLAMLPQGTYDLEIDAPASLRDTVLVGIGVVSGQSTDVGTVTLSSQ